MRRQLVLLRHGKSQYPHGVADHDRPLAPRGERQARLAGEWINREVGSFDLILCSTAKRTRLTLKHAGLKGHVKYLDELYTDAHLVYLEEIARHGAEFERIALVGHHPAISATAMALAANRDSDAARRMAHKFPTAAIAVLQGSEKFSKLETGHFNLEYFHVPER